MARNRQSIRISESLAKAREQAEIARAKADTLKSQAEISTYESMLSPVGGWGGVGWGELANPWNYRTDGSGGNWFALGAGNLSSRQYGRNRPFSWTDLDLDATRSLSRWLVVKNDFAAGLVRNLTNFTVKKGYKWEAHPAKGWQSDPEVVRLANRCQKILDEFSDLNKLPSRERSCVVRAVRDGEWFVRFFAQDDGRTIVRFIEPEQIREGGDFPFDPHAAFGIVTDPDDVETPLAYRVTYNGMDYEEIPAHDVCHHKCNVDECVKRGLSDFYACGELLEYVAKLLRNMTIAGGVQAAIAWIEQYESATSAQVSSYAAGVKDLNRPPFTNPITGRDPNFRKYEAGSIPLIGKGKEYIPPPVPVGSSAHIQIVQAALRSVAARRNIPEFMLTSDASNNNYASILITGSPFVNGIECDQQDLGQSFLRWRWVALRNACRAGLLGNYSFAEVMHYVDVNYTPPQVAVSNEGEQASIDHQDIAAGVLSLQTRRARRGLDDDQEKRNLEAEKPTRVAGQVTDIDAQGNPAKPGESGGGGEQPSAQERSPFAAMLESNKDGEATVEDDPKASAKMIAEVLYGLYGDDALKFFTEASEDDKVAESRLLPLANGLVLLQEKWNALDHPRGKNGRFIPKGSAEAVSAAKEAISRVVGGKTEKTPDSAEEVAKHLANLTVKQLKDIWKEHGKPIPSEIVRQQLIDAVMERLPGNSTAKGDTKDEPGQDDRGGSGGTGSASAGTGGSVEKEAERPASEPADQERDANVESDGEATPARVPVKTVPRDAAEVNRRLDRFEKFFHAKGQGHVANLMGKLREHINAVGAESALASLGGSPVEDAADKGDVQYWGVGTEEANWKHMGHFMEAYLARNGIIAVTGDSSNANMPLVSALGKPDKFVAGDFKPSEMHFKDKLSEAKTLPGLEASEDVSVIMGKPVTHLTAEVTAKLDEKYGQGQWIVKCYDDNAAAGYGIFFPQRAAAIAQDARNTIWTAGEHLGQYGFRLGRDPDTGKVFGLVHETGDIYQFGTEEYQHTINGDARHWAERAAAAADNERGAMLPEGSFMAQPAFKAVGISDAERAAGKTWHEKNEGRVHLVTRPNGSVEVVPHSTWLKGGNLPVVFEDDDTRAMARAAKEAIEKIPHEARKGQVYAPDVMKTADGYRVVELNAQGDHNGSGYLHDNHFTIDAYTSYLTGRQPAHVKFIRSLLAKQVKEQRESQQFVEAFAPRKEGEIWKGPSGRSFTLKNGRVVPAASQDAGNSVATPIGKIDTTTPSADNHTELTDKAVSAMGGIGAATKAIAAKVGDALWSTLNPDEQKTLAGAYAVGKWVMHHAETGMRKAKQMVEEAAKERGLSDDQAHRIARIVGIVDTALAWTVNVPVATVATGNPLLGKAAGLTPIASMAYLAYSTARNPMATLRAAKKAITTAAKHESVMREGVESIDVGVVVDAVAGIPPEKMNWFEALLSVACDQNGYDLKSAVESAMSAIDSQPEEGDSEVVDND